MPGTAKRAYDDGLALKDIYAAERQVEALFEQGGTVQFYGTALDLANCRVAVYHPAQQHLLAGVVAGLYAAHRGPDRPAAAPALRISEKAYARAWYDRGKHEIVLPRMRWSMSSFTVAHEVAHAATGTGHDGRSSHGHRWRKTFAAIARDCIGPEAGLLLMDAFDL
jgi:putative metallohydrolase (TIGR04338 family)